MFADYERLVRNYYERKKTEMELPLGLVFPSPAKLRSECERVCSERFNRKDEQVIRDFFGKSDDQKGYLRAIQQCKPDRFKPLIKFLNGRVIKTDEKNIELLAWLIDFPDRPFDLRKEYTSLKVIEAGVEVTEPVRGAFVDAPLLNEELQTADIEIEQDVAGSNEHNTYGGKRGTEIAVRNNPLHIELVRHKRKFRKVALVGVLLAVTGTGGFWLWDKMQTKDITSGNGSCMYWANDHFQPIPCSQKVPNTLVIALDTAMVKNFKKITRPDTITHQAKGHVWYSKINMKIEFFTADGVHPVVIGRRLKPITDYIINKYIHPGMALE